MDKKILDEKLNKIKQDTEQFNNWEEGLHEQMKKGSFRSILKYSWTTKAPLNLDKMFLIQAVSLSTFGDGVEGKNYYSLEDCLKDKIILDYKQDDGVTHITLNDQSRMTIMSITDLFPNLTKYLPQLLTQERTGQCHYLSFMLGNIISPKHKFKLASGYCSLQSSDKKYPHSWIEFDGGIEWCLDSTINAAINKDVYYKIFEPKDVVRIDGSVLRSDVSLLKKSSFINKDARYYLFFPDETREIMMEELEMES